MEMMTQPEQHKPMSWSTEALEALADLCQSEGLNPTRFQKLIDGSVKAGRKPSRQELIESLKHRPRIQERAEILRSISVKLYSFLQTYVDRQP